MAKYLLLFNASILSIFSLFIDGDVSVEMNVPGNIQPGDEFTVELVVKKTNVDGFAKIQVDLPDGLEASEGNSHTGKFTFSEQKVKILFWNLPPEDIFTITFKVKVSPSFTDDINLNGKLSYIVDNERKEVEFNQTNIENGSLNEENIAANTEVNPVDETDTEPIALNEPENNPNISTSRTINTNQIEAGQELTVAIHIMKEDLGGFAKIQDIIPAGFEAKEGESNGGKFSLLDNKVKILWMNLPSEPEFTVTYQLIATNDVSGDFKLDQGIFSYVLPEASDAKEIALETKSFVVIAEQIANVDPDNNINEQMEQDEDTNETNSESNNSENNVEIEAPNTKPAKGINYRVQICATHTSVDASYFVKNNNVTEEIFMDLHEGWTKFTVGNFLDYKQARNHRETVRANNNIVGPFVTAYNDGARITVQQALMLSQQKWVP